MQQDLKYIFNYPVRIALYMSRQHFSHCLAEMSFRWVNRDPKNVVTKMGKEKTLWKPNIKLN